MAEPRSDVEKEVASLERTMTRQARQARARTLRAMRETLRDASTKERPTRARSMRISWARLPRDGSGPGRGPGRRVQLERTANRGTHTVHFALSESHSPSQAQRRQRYVERDGACAASFGNIGDTEEERDRLWRELAEQGVARSGRIELGPGIAPAVKRAVLRRLLATDDALPGGMERSRIEYASELDDETLDTRKISVRTADPEEHQRWLDLIDNATRAADAAPDLPGNTSRAEPGTRADDEPAPLPPGVRLRAGREAVLDVPRGAPAEALRVLAGLLDEEHEQLLNPPPAAVLRAWRAGRPADEDVVIRGRNIDVVHWLRDETNAAVDGDDSGDQGRVAAGHRADHGARRAAGPQTGRAGLVESQAPGARTNPGARRQASVRRPGGRANRVDRRRAGRASSNRLGAKGAGRGPRPSRGRRGRRNAPRRRQGEPARAAGDEGQEADRGFATGSPGYPSCSARSSSSWRTSCRWSSARDALETWCKKNLDGLAWHAVIHRPEEKNDSRNWHAHIVYSNVAVERRRDGPGWTFEEPGAARPAPNETIRCLSGNGPQKGTGRNRLIQQWRKDICDLQNRHLAEIGAEKRYDHRSYATMGVDKQPGEHLGPGRFRRDLDGDARATGAPSPYWTDVEAELRKELRVEGARAPVRDLACDVLELSRLLTGIPDDDAPTRRALEAERRRAREELATRASEEAQRLTDELIARYTAVPARPAPRRRERWREDLAEQAKIADPWLQGAQAEELFDTCSGDPHFTRVSFLFVFAIAPHVDEHELGCPSLDACHYRPDSSRTVPWNGHGATHNTWAGVVASDAEIGTVRINRRYRV